MASAVNLPEDALTEILLRLPVKSMVRFRSVSKSWFALLRSPHFIDMHLKFSLARDDEHVLIRRFLTEERKNVLSIHSNDEALSVMAPNLEVQGFSNEFLQFVGCCNGIVCLTIASRTVGVDFVLLNPATREFRKLPPRPFYLEGVGFGFDPASNEYKVIRIARIDDDNDSAGLRAEIYNLSNDSWRELDVIPPPIQHYYGGFNLFFNGSIHWCTLEGASERILSLSISTEVFHKFRFPEACQSDGEAMPHLAVIHDNLAVIFYTDIFWPEESFNVWVMKEYGIDKSWSKQYRIGPLSGIERPIIVWKNERLLLVSGNIMDCDGQLVACDLFNCQELRKYDIYGLKGAFDVVFYKETLISITNH